MNPLQRPAILVHQPHAGDAFGLGGLQKADAAHPCVGDGHQLQRRVVGVFARTVVDVPVEVLWFGVLNALACTVAPVLMVMMAVERIGAALTAQTGMIGPMSTIALGVLLLDERCVYCF